MCQNSVFMYLKKQRETGDTSFYTIRELMCALNIKEYRAFVKKVNKLYAFGFLDCELQKGEGTAYTRRGFRIKDTYTKKAV
jgi:hypothetical protein